MPVAFWVFLATRYLAKKSHRVSNGFVYFLCRLSDSAASSSNKRQQEQHDKNKEQNFCYRRSACCDAKEAEDPGYDCYDQKDHCPT